MDNLEPKICMKRDFVAAEFVVSRVKLAETVSIIGLPQSGKTVIFDYLLTHLEQMKGNYTLLDATITSEAEAHEILGKISTVEKVILLVNISSEQDLSFFINEIELIRKKRSVSFIPVILTYVTSVQEAFNKKTGVLVRSCFMLNGVSDTDAEILLHDFEKRFKLGLTNDDFNSIIPLVAGSAGLLKSLYFYYSVHKNNTSLQELIKDASISSRIKPILECFEENLLLKWFHGSISTKDSILLEQLGFNPHDMPPLFREYVRTFLMDTVNEAPNTLTKLEKSVFNYLHFHLDNVVEKGEIAKVMWGKEWKEKYSDEAIDQLLSRIRRKIGNGKYVVKTHKGIGYSLNS